MTGGRPMNEVLEMGFGDVVTMVLARAADEAAWLRAPAITVDHVGLALTVVAADIVEVMGCDPRRWRDATIYFLGFRGGFESAMSGTGLAPEAHDRGGLVADGTISLLEDAVAEATRGGYGEPSLGHLLAGVLRIDAPTAAANGRELGLTSAAARSVTGLPPRTRELAGGGGPDASRRPTRPPTVVLRGGGAGDAALPAALERIALLTGRQTSALRVAVIAAASGEGGDRTAERMSAWANAFDTGIDERSDAERVAADLLDGVDVVYFTGGDAARAYDAVWATPLADALADFADRGGVVMGSSAGAILLGCRTLSSWVNEGVPEPIPALGWLPRTIVTAHHTAAPRAVAFSSAIEAFPDHRVIAVAHGGAVLVAPDGEISEVHQGVTASVVWEGGATYPIAPWP